MKKTFLALMIALLAVPAFAGNEQRKTSSGEISAYSTAVTTVASTLYDVDCVVTTAGGWCAIYDQNSAPNNPTGTKKVESREGTQYNSKHTSFGEEGLKFYNGIAVYTNNATAIVTYY